jgi:glycosyltransferase involved in cell wall biosynthesis
MYLSHLGVNIPDIQAAKKHNHLRIVSCSNIIPVKRVHLIAEALEKISSEITIEWIHFGAGKELDSLQKYCKKQLAPLAHITYTFAGQKTNKEVLSFYSENYIDVFINVSSSEGIPVSIMEAQSYGIPCIATDVGGNRELISDKENGFLLSSDASAHEIADTIQSVWKLSNDEAEKMRYASHKRIIEKFNAEKNYTIFIEKILTSTV